MYLIFSLFNMYKYRKHAYFSQGMCFRVLKPNKVNTQIKP